MIRHRRGRAPGQAASFSRALDLIIAAPFSAIMIVGALVFVELTAGITEAVRDHAPKPPAEPTACWPRRGRCAM